MNETNNDKNQKPKTSKLAKASIICIGVFFGLILVMFGFYILMGLSIGIFVTIDNSYPWLAAFIPEGFFTWLFESTWPTWFERGYFLVLKYTFFGAPILGIAALIHIWLSKRRLRGIYLAISAIVIPIAITLFLIGLNHAKIAIQRSVCVSS